MQDIESVIEEIAFNLDQFLQLVDVHLEHLSQEKVAKLEELQPLLADADTPPGVLIAAQLAALRRSYNHDQLSKVRHFLRLGRESVEKIDDLPYVWNGR